MLASASPRRRELLRAAGLEPTVRASAVSEDLPAGIEPVRAALLLAERKARAVAGELAAEGRGGTEGRGGAELPAGAFVIGADTIVAIETPGEPGGERLLGKPADEAEAAAMLRLLSGSRHRVVTGVAVVAPGGELLAGSETTWVTMRPLSAAEVTAYVASGEWRDKAGGYAIQESADAFVTRLEEGGFDNVVGLPVGLTLALLRRAGALA